MIRSIIPEGLAKFFRTKVDGDGAAVDALPVEEVAVEGAPVVSEEPAEKREAINSYVDLGAAVITITGTTEEAHENATQIAALFEEHFDGIADKSPLENMNVYFTVIPYPELEDGKMNLRGLAIGRTGDAFSVVGQAVHELSQNPEHKELFSQITMLYGTSALSHDVLAKARPSLAGEGSDAGAAPLPTDA